DIPYLPRRRTSPHPMLLLKNYPKERQIAQVKITVRKNGPYRVEAPEGSIELVDAKETLTTLPVRRPFRCVAAAGRFQSLFVTEPTAGSAFRPLRQRCRQAINRRKNYRSGCDLTRPVPRSLAEAIASANDLLKCRLTVAWPVRPAAFHS